MKFLVKGIKNASEVSIYFRAKNSEIAKQKAYRRGIVPLEIIELVDNPLFFSSSFLGRQFEEIISWVFLRGMFYQELFLSFKQIAFMIEAALPIEEIFRQCTKTVKHKKLKAMYKDILHSISGGISLATAFGKFNGLIGEMRISFIEVGQNSGNLSEIFSLLADELQAHCQEIAKIKKKLFYPCLVFVCMIIAFGVLSASVIPAFLTLFSEVGLELPLATQALVLVADVFVKWGVLMAIFVGVLILFLKQLPKSLKSFRLKIHHYLLVLPLVGKIFLCKDIYHYFLAFYLCERAGLEIKSCLKNAFLSLQNAHIKIAFSSVEVDIAQGKGLGDAFFNTHLLDSIAKALVITGEKSGNLEKTLQMCAEHYYRLYTKRLEQFDRWVEPMLTLFVGSLVMWFALAILLPMWNLNDFNL